MQERKLCTISEKLFDQVVASDKVANSFSRNTVQCSQSIRLFPNSTSELDRTEAFQVHELPSGPVLATLATGTRNQVIAFLSERVFP